VRGGAREEDEDVGGAQPRVDGGQFLSRRHIDGPGKLTRAKFVQIRALQTICSPSTRIRASK
jgi:hypothetical protein